MLRVDLHVLKAVHGRHLQNARGATLARYSDVHAAISAAREHATNYVLRGLSARVTIHWTGKRPEIQTFIPRSP